MPRGVTPWSFTDVYIFYTFMMTYRANRGHFQHCGVPLGPFPVSTIPRNVVPLLALPPLISFAWSWTSHKWNHSVCILLCLVFANTVSKIYWCCVYEKHSFIFYCYVAFYYMNIGLFIHSPLDKYVSCLQFGTITNKAAVNILLYVLWYTEVFISLVCIPRSGIVRS